jgi:hypothetical protein
MMPPRRPTALLRYLVPAFLLCLAVYYLTGTGQDDSNAVEKSPSNVPDLSHNNKSKPTDSGKGTAAHGAPEAKPTPQDLTTTTSASTHIPTKTPGNAPSSSTHPIDSLIAKADEDFDAVLTKESHTLAEAAAAYRERRGRHPPPGFDQWYNLAKEKNAVIVEDFWDRVYHDLEPFWAVAPGLVRRQAWDYEMTISLRDHNATAGSDWFWTQIWLSLVKSVEHLLPDLDIALNAMDEPRLVVPWEDMAAYMTRAHTTRHMPDASKVISEFQKLAKPGSGPDKDIEVPQKEWEGDSTYSHAATMWPPTDTLQSTTGKLSVAAARPPVSSAKPRS